MGKQCYRTSHLPLILFIKVHSILGQYVPDHLLHGDAPDDVLAGPAGGAGVHLRLACPADFVAVLAGVDLTSHQLQADWTLSSKLSCK